MKKVLILCTGNSCRSIIAEALINAKLDGVEAKSSGVRANGKVNPNAKRLLEAKGIWKENYHSKTLDTLIDEPFDLVVTVCDHANETCPMFPRPIAKIHVGFVDPDGKGYEAFEETYRQIQEVLLPQVKAFFEIKKEVNATQNGVKINFSGFVTKQKIEIMVNNCQSGKCECLSDATKSKINQMTVSGEDGDVKLVLDGEVSADEIKEALSKSKVLN